MKKQGILAVCLTLMMMLTSGQAVLANPARLEHTTASLASEYDAIDGSRPFYLLFDLDIIPGWHTYWVNPGDSGLATSIEWDLPPGFKAGDIVWQPPDAVRVGPLVDYAYSGHAWHLVEITPPATLPSGPYTFTAKASWLVCHDICIPEKAELTLTVQQGEANTDSVQAGHIRSLLQNVASLPNLSGQVQVGDSVVARFPAESFRSLLIEDAYFYPQENGIIDHAAPQTVTITEDGFVEMTLVPAFMEFPASLGGFLEIHDDQGEYTASVNLVRSDTPPTAVTEDGDRIVIADDMVAAVNNEEAAPAPGVPAAIAEAQPIEPIGPARQVPEGIALPEAPVSLLVTILFAFLGGIVLNAMPCVFPVLSLKALGLAKKARGESREARLHGLAYTLGVLLFFGVLGGTLIGIKSTGAAVGWGYQMQSPLFIGVLTYLLFMIGLNLSGLFEFRLLFTIGQPAGAAKDTPLNSFMTGALAAIVATPCTAPFMATAIGAALVQPAVIAMGIFLSLGLGLAFPYLLLCYVPALRGWMPRPGHWMVTFRQFLAFPMFLSAVWLVWVFAQQTDVNDTGLLLAGLVALALALWLWQVIRNPLWRMLWTGLALLLAFWPLGGLKPADGAAVPAAQAMQQDGIQTEAFDLNRLELLRMQNVPVFVNATAAWCITCKVNERVALHTERVEKLFHEKGIVFMTADWTNQNDEITEYLASFGRSGVPLYVYYPAEGSARVLPQLLTPDSVAEVLTTNPDRTPKE